MIGPIAKILGAAVGAAGIGLAAKVAQELYKFLNGKYPHEIVIERWDKMREEICSWLRANVKNKKIKGVLLKVVNKIDDVRVDIQNAASIGLRAYAVTDKGENILITEHVLSKDEVKKLYPELVKKSELFVPFKQWNSMELTQ